MKGRKSHSFADFDESNLMSNISRAFKGVDGAWLGKKRKNGRLWYEKMVDFTIIVEITVHYGIKQTTFLVVLFKIILY